MPWGGREGGGRRRQEVVVVGVRRLGQEVGQGKHVCCVCVAGLGFWGGGGPRAGGESGDQVGNSRMGAS